MEERFETFTSQISRISGFIRKIKSEEISYYDLKGSHVSCLYYLYRSETPMTAKELAVACEEDKAAISRTLVSLEESGYIECESKTEKRYNSPISLTNKGKEVGVFIENKIDSILQKAGEGLSEENRKIFYESLALISENLRKICDGYGE